MLRGLGEEQHAQERSLREKVRDKRYDADDKPRLNYARNYCVGFSLDQDVDFQELQAFYRNWRDFIE
jgi:hypothetical protein